MPDTTDWDTAVRLADKIKADISAEVFYFLAIVIQVGETINKATGLDDALDGARLCHDAVEQAIRDYYAGRMPSQMTKN